jgi:Plavaka transposase
MPLSFGSGDALVQRLETLPSSGTTWMAHDINPGSGTFLEPVTLFFRDPMKAIESLLQRPTFKDSLDFVPRRVWSDPQDPDDPERRERNYQEIFSGEWAWRTQVSFQLHRSYTCSDAEHIPGNASTWGRVDTSHSGLRLNCPYCFLWR